MFANTVVKLLWHNLKKYIIYMVLQHFPENIISTEKKEYSPMRYISRWYQPHNLTLAKLGK